MAEVVNTQIMSSNVGQVNGVGKVLGQKFDDGVWINFCCNVTKPASFPFFQQGYHAKHTENTRMHKIKKHASFLPIQHKFIKWCLFITNWTNPSCFPTTEQDTLFLQLLTWIILCNIINHCLVDAGQELNEEENNVNKNTKRKTGLLQTTINFRPPIPQFFHDIWLPHMHLFWAGPYILYIGTPSIVYG